MDAGAGNYYCPHRYKTMLKTNANLLALYPEVSSPATILPIVIFLSGYFDDFFTDISYPSYEVMVYAKSLHTFRNFIIHYDNTMVLPNFIKVDNKYFDEVLEYAKNNKKFHQIAVNAMVLLHQNHNYLLRIIRRVSSKNYIRPRSVNKQLSVFDGVL